MYSVPVVLCFILWGFWFRRLHPWGCDWSAGKTEIICLVFFHFVDSLWEGADIDIFDLPICLSVLLVLDEVGAFSILAASCKGCDLPCIVVRCILHRLLCKLHGRQESVEYVHVLRLLGNLSRWRLFTLVSTHKPLDLGAIWLWCDQDLNSCVSIERRTVPRPWSRHLIHIFAHKRWSRQQNRQFTPCCLSEGSAAILNDTLPDRR